MRHTPVSLPTKPIAYDPHEKPDRYDNSREPNTAAKMQSAWASQAQRARYIKTGALLFVVFLVFYYFSPAGVDLYNEGRFSQLRVSGRAVAHQPLHSILRGPWAGPDTVRLVIRY
jgi:hypothetical protein